MTIQVMLSVLPAEMSCGLGEQQRSKKVSITSLIFHSRSSTVSESKIFGRRWSWK